MSKEKEQVVDIDVIDETLEEDIEMEIPEEESPKKKWYQTKWAKMAGAVVGLGAVYVLGVRNGRNVASMEDEDDDYSETPTQNYIDVESEEISENIETNE